MPDPNGIVQTNPMNKPQAKFPHNFNTFDDTLSYRLANTLRFGEYTPSFTMEGVPDDEISVNSLDIMDSLSLKAPFKGSIRKIKESFKVPLMAILPKNWDQIYVQPSNGDDVPKLANCVLHNFPKEMSDFFKAMYENVATALAAIDPSSATIATTFPSTLTALLRFLLIGEYIYSNGSLLSVCGYHASNQFSYVGKGIPNATQDEALNGVSYDRWMDAIIQKVFSNVKEMAVEETVGNDSNIYIVRGVGTSGEFTADFTYRKSSFRFLLEKMRDNPLMTVNSVTLNNATTAANFATLLQGLAGTNGLVETGKIEFTLPEVNDTDVDSEDHGMFDMSQCNLNLSRLLAYQLVCAHFYSNSSIDIIYSAELFRQYFSSLEWNQAANGQKPWRFTQNGVSKEYDYLSGYSLERLLYLKAQATHENYGGFSWNTLKSPSDYIKPRFAAFAAVFGFRHSLRFGDYFVGSRPRPLAPINTDVAVNNSAVSVLDITRNIQAQKFANSVMRTRQKIEEYVKSIFKNAPAPDYHNPFFLAREAEIIFGDEVQNTGAAQASNPNSRTANFAANTDRYTFTFNNDDAHPCVYLQIISFDIKRAYTRSVDRQFLHFDRFDMFNPDFQYIGDQPIYGIELGYREIVQGSGVNVPVFKTTFAYQSRDMEYKQRFDVAAGGFVENLPGWLLTDRVRDVYQPAKLSPDFIRNFNAELDQFYISMTGYSLGNYFHFICITNNNVSAKRPMAVDPQILE